ncbi:MAG: signal peptidase II [Caldilineaceae bacterium]|nr:signal peptidase II [Caldilineaceae bacterium]
MARLKRVMVLILVLFLIVGCDQTTKSVAQSQLRNAEPISLFNNVVLFKYAENPGAFLSLGAGLSPTAQQWIFTVLVSLVLLALLIYILKNLQRMPFMVLIALALFLGGGLGNLIDRLVNDGRVIDFMNIGIGNLRTGVFNVADMSLMAGLAVMAFFGFRSHDTTP